MKNEKNSLIRMIRRFQKKLPLFHAADGMKPVRVFLAVEDSCGVKRINPHVTRRVDNPPITHADAHMDDTSSIILEEGEVVALHVTEANLIATGRLLRSIAWQPDAHSLEAHLRQSGAVDTSSRTATPEIRCIEEAALRQVGGVAERHNLLVVHPALIAIVLATHPRPFFLPLDHFHRVARQELVHHLGPIASLSPHRHSRKKTKTLHQTYFLTYQLQLTPFYRLNNPFYQLILFVVHWIILRF